MMLYELAVKVAAIGVIRFLAGMILPEGNIRKACGFGLSLLFISVLLSPVLAMLGEPESAFTMNYAAYEVASDTAASPDASLIIMAAQSAIGGGARVIAVEISQGKLISITISAESDIEDTVMLAISQRFGANVGVVFE